MGGTTVIFAKPEGRARDLERALAGAKVFAGLDGATISALAASAMRGTICLR